MPGLFRDEVLQERRTQFLGTIRIGRNPSFTLVSVVAVVLACALVSYAAWGEIARKARLAGILIAVPGPNHEGRSGRLVAHLFAPGRTAAVVQPGQVVWIRYAAYPHQKFGLARGTIESVGRTPLRAQDLPGGRAAAPLNAAPPNATPMHAAANVEPIYGVTVALESQAMRGPGDAQPLQAGMTLEADVVEERRRVWAWLLEPVLAASGLAKTRPGPSP